MAGGIERMAVALMNEMCVRGHDVSLLTWDEAGAKAFYDFDTRIKWYNLDLGAHTQKAGWKLRLKRMQKMRKQIRDINPQAILAFQHGTFLATRLYSTGQGYPVVAAEREAPARFDHLKAGKWQNIIYQSFRLAKNITIQCESYRDDYPKYLRKKIVVIPNPVFPSTQYADPGGRGCERKTLLCVGRLSYQKNQSVLLKAFAQIHKEFPNWNLLFAGEGDDRKILECEIKTLGIEEQVALLGAVKDTKQLYCASHLLCLSARWEGFPNVIAESLSHGLPVVGFDGCAGVRDLIKHGHNGLLANGNGASDTLAEQLKIAMSDDILRCELGANGIQSMKPFAPSHIFDRWEKFLVGLAK